jgi:trigger factor
MLHRRYHVAQKTGSAAADEIFLILFRNDKAKLCHSIKSMNIISKKLPKSQVELTIEVAVEDLDKYLKQATQKISQSQSIPGFRPGKAPYDIVKQKFGEMAIYQEALDPLIKDTLAKAFEQEKLEIIGQPQIDVDKLAPNNPVVYRATVTLLPKAKIKNYKNIKVKPKKIEVSEEKIQKTLEQLQKMRAKESAQDKKIEIGDKAFVDFSIYLDKVPIDGGQHKDYPVYLGENFFIPGFEEQLLGLKKGEEKEFELKFPKEYFQKNLAGKLAEFKVKIKDVFKVERPELNDEFAKMINFANMNQLKDHIRQNIEQEEKMQDEQRMEIEILDEIIKQSEFDELPQILIDGELDKMLAELQGNIAQQGVKFEDYLKSLKTTEENLRENFLPQARKRLQTSLIIREIAALEKISVDEKEVEQEIEQMLQKYNDENSAKQIRSDGYKRYLENLLINRKTIEKLKEWNVER